MTDRPDDFWSGPGWYPQQIDVYFGRLLLARLGEQEYRGSIFLDQRRAGRDAETRVVELWSLAEEADTRSPGAAAYIFHIGHCGSTMVSRVLQSATDILPLREPVPLRALASLQREAGEPLATLDTGRVQALSHLLYNAYARTFPGNSQALIKATSSCSNLIGPVLSHHPDNRALFLYLPLEPFLATVLKSDLLRQETVQFARSRLADLHRLTGDDSIRIYDLHAGELAAMSWAANMLWWERHRQHVRLLGVDFEALLNQPVETCARIATFFGIESDADRLRQAYAQVSAAYSKDPQTRYSRAARDAQLERCRQLHRKEIESGIRWAARLAEDYPALTPLI